MLRRGRQWHVTDLRETFRVEQIADNILWRDADAGNSREADRSCFRWRLGRERSSAAAADSPQRAETPNTRDGGVGHEAASALHDRHRNFPSIVEVRGFKPSARA